MGKKAVVLSFDYELFFGVRSGTVLNTLITPTSKIMEAMESVGLRGNFFVDVLMIKSLKQNLDTRSREDLMMIEEQLREIVKRGHRIELHLHPHWVDAKYNGDGVWDFSDYSHYMLSTFKEEEIVHMFTEGVNYLNSLASQVQPDYKVCAFRAGGWAVQPFKKLKRAFVENGIVIDSSTGYGRYDNSPNAQYDFRNMPMKSLFRFSDDVCMEDKNGRFIEVPISTYYRGFISSIIHRLTQIKNRGYNSSQTDGTHYRNDAHHKPAHGRLYFFLHPKSLNRMMSFSSNDPFTIKHSFKQSKSSLLCYIDHPKDFSKATCDCIQSLGRLNCVSKNYIDLI